MIDLSAAVWRKSSRSNSQGQCVEVADNLVGVVGVRDSKDSAGPALTVDRLLGRRSSLARSPAPSAADAGMSAHDPARSYVLWVGASTADGATIMAIMAFGHALVRRWARAWQRCLSSVRFEYREGLVHESREHGRPLQRVDASGQDHVLLDRPG